MEPTPCGPTPGDPSPVLLPGRCVFAELVVVALRAADAQAGTRLPDDPPDDRDDVADALHERLERVYGHHHNRAGVPLPPLRELLRMLAGELHASPTADSGGSAGSGRDELAALYLAFFLAQPRAPHRPRAEPADRAAVTHRELAAFVAGDLSTDAASRVSLSLLASPLSPVRLRDVLDIASTPIAAREVGPREPMPDEVWVWIRQRLARAQQERDQRDTDPGSAQ